MMKTYTNYKASGVEWLGDIPESWETRKLKFMAKIKNGLDYKHVEVHDENSGYPVLGSGGQFAYASTYLFSGESVLLGRKGTIDKPQYVNCKCWVVDTVFYTEIFACVSIKFFYYCCCSLIQFDLYATNTALPSMTQTDLNNISLSFPPLSEQQTIANYLDKKTAQIARFIENKKKLIQLLEEEKKALITQAVTRGLDKSVRLKPSGVEWLGDIPEHWEVRKLKYLANFKSGDSITSENIRDFGEYPVFGGNGLRGFTTSYTHSGHYVLIGRQGALCGNINYATGKFWASEHAVVISISNNYETIWLGEILRIMDLNQYSQSAAQPGLSVEKIKNLFIGIPSLPEQQAIVAHIEKQSQKIEEVISKYQKEIELIIEYRQRLIYDAVTGKIKLC